MEAPLGELERRLIDAFLVDRGIDAAALARLPAGEREQLLREASIAASARLSEIESRERLLADLHQRDTNAPGPKL